MAIKRKTASKPKKTTQNADGARAKLKGFVASRIVDAVGLGCIIFAVFAVFSILSYHAGDPSLNTAAGAAGASDTQNWMGVKGAVLSDVLVQSFGLAPLIWMAVIGVWGWRIYRRAPFYGWAGWRLVCFVMSGLFVALSFARLPDVFGAYGGFYLGGVFGSALLNMIVDVAHGLIGGTVYWLVPIVAFMLGVVAAMLACGFAPQTWVQMGVRVQIWAQALWASLFAMIGWVSDHDRGAPQISKRKKVPVARKAPIIETSQDIGETQAGSPSPAATADKVNEPQIIKPKKAATPPKQKSFALPDTGDWTLPPVEMLQEDTTAADVTLDERALQHNADLLQQVMEDYNIQGEITKVRPGPVVTLYEFEPAPGTKSSRVISLSDDIARSMSAVSVRCAVVPGRTVIGIEIPNAKRKIVYMRNIVESREYEESKAKLPIILGQDIGGEPIIADLARMPHLLVAGTTGSGKSVAVNTMLMSLLFRLPPEKCRFIMIDPKMLELSVYDDIPHLLSPVVTDPGKAVVALKWAVHEMETRYMAMSKLGVRNIEGYNARIREAVKKGEDLTRKVQTGFDPDTGKPVYEEQPMELVELPYIVIIVDEFADLMLVAGKDVESSIQRLAQMARAAGLHIIMATQRPSVDVITGVIKANFPTRISFAVTSKIDSRTILGEGGAEQLLGMGDMLYMASGGRIKRVHGPFVADEEVEEVVNHLKAQAEPMYLEDVTEGSEGSGGFGGEGGDGEGGSSVDDLYDEAVAIIAREGKASTSFIQRHLQIGYNRAARIIEEMERQGVVSPANRVGKREVLVGDQSGGS